MIFWAMTLVSFRKGKVKRGSLVGRSLGPSLAAMSLNDPPHGRQANTRARKIPIRVQPLKRTKQLAFISRVEAGTVIANYERRLSLDLDPKELDQCRRLFGRELPSVA